MARILVVPALTGMPISGRSMNRFSLAALNIPAPYTYRNPFNETDPLHWQGVRRHAER